MVKKAFMKTVEATFAIVIFLLFLSYLSINQARSKLQTTPEEIKTLQNTIFKEIETNGNFRTIIFDNGDKIQIGNFISNNKPAQYKYQLNWILTDSASTIFIGDALPSNKQVYADILIISRLTDPKTAYITLYLWEEI